MGIQCRIGAQSDCLVLKSTSKKLLEVATCAVLIILTISSSSQQFSITRCAMTPYTFQVIGGMLLASRELVGDSQMRTAIVKRSQCTCRLECISHSFRAAVTYACAKTAQSLHVC
jgi:hypothetical protein